MFFGILSVPVHHGHIFSGSKPSTYTLLPIPLLVGSYSVVESFGPRKSDARPGVDRQAYPWYHLLAP